MYIYINLSTSNTFADIYENLYNMLIYINCKNNAVDVSSQNFRKFRKLQENSSPIVLMKVLTIVLKEGRSERGYNPETPSNFPHHSSVMLTG